MAKNKYEYTENDYEFMNSLSSAVLERTPGKISTVLKIWFVTILAFIVWASFTQVDEITRGSGDVVPSGENQIIQNLEGGIVSEILVNEGELVKANQVLIKINNSQSTSSAASNEIKIHELEAKSLRLRAESKDIPFIMPKTNDETFKQFIKLEYGLYLSNQTEVKEKDASVIQQIEQKKHELTETRKRVKHLRQSLSFVNQEVKMTAPMVKEGIKSRVDFLKLQRESNEIEQKLDSARLSIPSLKSQISEYRHKRLENKLSFQNKAKKERNEVRAEIKRISSDKTAFDDQLSRTDVRSPVDGIVQKLYVHTKGGVIKPGDDIVEIVPTNDNLLLAVKIKPSDIAFIHPGAEVMVKFSAYDFAIHGGLKGKVTRISPDTITDKKDETFYMIYVSTEKSYLGSEKNPLSIIPGMMVDVDIVTGKKTIMQYILKPILKSKQYVFSER